MVERVAADRRRRRWPARLAAASALILSLVLAGAWIWVDRSAPRHAGRVALEGLGAPVGVVRDGHGIPHVFAASAADAYLAQGFVHAQDRFAQMDGMRMVARGRLSELVGRAGLSSDRFMRGMGLVERAQARSWMEATPRCRSNCVSPAAGPSLGRRSIRCSGAS
jgi:penicillin amidase